MAQGLHCPKLPPGTTEPLKGEQSRQRCALGAKYTLHFEDITKNECKILLIILYQYQLDFKMLVLTTLG